MIQVFRQLALSSLLILFAVSSAHAETRLICENERREYLVIYSSGDPTLILNPNSDATEYQFVQIDGCYDVK